MSGVFQATVQYDTGAVVPTPSIRVRSQQSGADANIFSDAALSIALPNPFNADEFGFFRFYVAAGRYRITATKDSYEAEFRDVPIGNAAERDAGELDENVMIVGDADDAFLNADENLADLTDAATARTNLGLGSMATENAGDYISNYELAAAFAALGTAAYFDVGTGAGEIPTVDDLGTMAFQDSDNVGITGGSIVIDTFYAQNDSYFGGVAGDTANDYSVEILEVASAVNHLQLKGAVTGIGVEINAAGTDANIDIKLTPKGSGSVEIVGTTHRFKADFSNATVASRLLLQTSTANGNTNIGAIPNGTSQTAAIRAYNNSNPTDASFVQFAVTGSTAVLSSDITGTGTYLPLTFQTSGLNRIQITTAGRTLMGATLPTDDLANPVQIQGSIASGLKVIGRGTIQNGDFGLLLGADSGVTTLTNNTNKAGRLAVPHYANAEEPLIVFRMFATNTANFISIGGNDASANTATTIAFFTAGTTTTLTGTEAARFDSSQRLLIGTTTAGTSKLRVADETIEITTAKTPASAAAAGTTGAIAWDANYIYVCIAANTWRRVAHATW